MSHKFFKKNNKHYCNNCGKFGHYFKTCMEPITSNGIICFKYDSCLSISTNTISKFTSNKYIEIDSFNYNHLDNISKLDTFKDKIYFLLIRRKHTLSYIEFIRGRYIHTDLNKLKKMFELMTQEEIYNISGLNFRLLWSKLWKKTSKSKIYQKEYNKSKVKFNHITSSKLIHKLIKIKPLYDTPEWGFPKGRRNNFEKNIDCAIREFEEETNMNNKDYDILNNISSVQENYTGTNNIDYRHIYYLGISPYSSEINYECMEDNYEIGDIRWVTWEKAVQLLRPYYYSKIELLNKIFLFSLNLYEESTKLLNQSAHKVMSY